MTYAVEDVPAWKARCPERIAFFAPFAADVADYLPTDGSSVVAVTMNVNDMLAFTAAVLVTPEHEENDGLAVSRPFTIWIQEDDFD